jgi:hypothetical protein
MPNAILDPTGRTAVLAAAGAGRPAGRLAPRRSELTGLRVGLLENTKHNAALLLDELGALLEAEHGARVTRRATKQVFAMPVSDEVVAEFAGNCDVVITAIGDCGSCSASAVADGIRFEQAGLPAAVVCSEAFVATADAMAELRGATGYRYATTAHPVAVLSPPQVAERAKHLLPEVVGLLTGERA